MNVVPPPKFSDGVTYQHNIEPGWQEATSEYIRSFFQPFTDHIKRYYQQLPDRIPIIHSTNGQLFTESAGFPSLPRMYKLYYNTQGHVRIFGHPSGMYFQSIAEFMPHLLWLINDNGTFVLQCSCNLCQIPMQDLRPVANAAGLPFTAAFQQQQYMWNPAGLPSHFMDGNMLGSGSTTPQSPLSSQHSVQRPSVQDRLLDGTMNQMMDITYETLVSQSVKPNIPLQINIGQPMNMLKSPIHVQSPQPPSAKASPSKQVQLPSSNIKKPSQQAAQLEKQKQEELSEKIKQARKQLESIQTQIKRLKFERRVLLEASIRDKRPAEDVASVDSMPPSDVDVQSDSERKKPKKKRKKMRFLTDDAPKRPANAYMLFCEMERANVKEQVANQDEGLSITKALGAKWKNLGAEEKKFYQDLFHEKVGEYNVQLEKYMKDNPDSFIILDEKPQKKKIDPDTPKKPPANAFMVYCEMERDNVKEERRRISDAMPGAEIEAGLGNIPKVLGQRWKALSDQERQGIEIHTSVPRQTQGVGETV
ncbi:hypothetical protein EDD86DRAFT_199621 [Gorgonomyces haynaldii]|nr:hypothetical protein EDD86DRAFT_199621 [Gorgonomyces haynaldii]